MGLRLAVPRCSADGISLPGVPSELFHTAERSTHQPPSACTCQTLHCCLHCCPPTALVPPSLLPHRPVYDVLLDDYEKGMTAARLDEIFGQVKAGLVPLLVELRERGTPPSGERD